jgi:hypothetical protein
MRTRNRIINISLIIFLIFLAYATADAQGSGKKKKAFQEAESFRLYNDFELAIPLYIYSDKTDNYNIKYKIGTCYLNIPGDKEKAIPYLESAVKHSSIDSKSSSYKEKRAPLESYFFLGKAYLINNDLDKALNTFETFKTLVNDSKKGVENYSFIDQQIRACQNAMKNEHSPSGFSREPLRPGFRSEFLIESPAVSFDGKTLVYTERRGAYNAIMYTKKIQDKWQTPVEINSWLKAGNDCSTCSLNFDGTILYLYKTDNYDGNIYSAKYVNGYWSPIVRLNSNINSKFYESHASVSYDGKKLYFTSNRDGGHGGLDIYVSALNTSGDWGPALNLGVNINTEFNEDTPFITLNDSILYFSSEGHNGMGLFDIFRSRLYEKGWSNPENLGFPVNSTDDDLFFQPFNNDENGFYSMTTDYKVKAIFYITLSNSRLNRVFEISGNYSLRDTLTKSDENRSVFLVDKNSNDTIETTYPDKNGHYNFIASPGKYRLIFAASDYYPQSIDTSFALNHPSRIINIKDVTLEKSYAQTNVVHTVPAVSVADQNIIRNLQVKDVTDDDKLDTTILYYTVQVMALHNPVDINYFSHVSDIKVFYNNADKFYRYTSGIFKVKDEAYTYKNDLISKGFEDDLFVKKVAYMDGENPVPSEKYYVIQLKALKSPIINKKIIFGGLEGVKESKEIDGMYHYFYGRFVSADEAKAAMKDQYIKDFSDAFVREIQILNKK